MMARQNAPPRTTFAAGEQSAAKGPAMLAEGEQGNHGRECISERTESTERHETAKNDVRYVSREPQGPNNARQVEADSKAYIRTRCIQMALPAPVEEHRFCERGWRLDLAWPDYLVAMELEGGIWTEGRHTRGAGFVADLEKYNEAVCRGWYVLRVTHEQVRDDTALFWLERVLRGEER